MFRLRGSLEGWHLARGLHYQALSLDRGRSKATCSPSSLFWSDQIESTVSWNIASNEATFLLWTALNLTGRRCVCPCVPRPLKPSPHPDWRPKEADSLVASVPQLQLGRHPYATVGHPLRVFAPPPTRTRGCLDDCCLAYPTWLSKLCRAGTGVADWRCPARPIQP